MPFAAKLIWVALPALAGCGVLSEATNQGVGTNPGGKLSQKLPTFESVEKRIAFIDNADAVYKQANFRPKWIDTVPQEFRNWENGARQTLTNNGKVLSYAQVEHIREVVRSFAKYDQRLSREASLKLVEPLPKAQRDKALAKVVFEVTKDALAHAGINNPSNQLVQVVFSDASAYWANRFVKYDTAVTDKYFHSKKYWPQEPAELSVGDCNFFALAQRNVQRAGAAIVLELKGLTSTAQGGTFKDVGMLGSPSAHVFVVTSIPMSNGRIFKIVHNPTATDSDDDLTTGITRLGLSESEMALFSSTMAPYFSSEKTSKYFNGMWTGGDRPGEYLNLGNLNLRYLSILNNPYASSPLTEAEKRKIRNLELSLRTEWDAWRKSNEDGISRLRKTIYGR